MKKIFLPLLLCFFIIFSFFMLKSLKVFAEEQKVYPKIFMKKGSGDSFNGGVITQSSLEKPVIQIGSYEQSGKAKVSIFQATDIDLLSYLIHDELGNQKTKFIDTSKLKKIGETEVEIESGFDKSKDFLLPIESSGIFLLKTEFNSKIEDFIVVRADSGVLLKEGKDKFIFWGQDLKTGKKKKSGTLKIYSLKNQIKELAQKDFDSNGIVETSFFDNADIALATFDNDIVFVPINMMYLNQDYKYSGYFENQKIKNTKYFVFVDRPLYRPADKIFFKALMRDNDDYSYFVSKGKAKIKVYRDWDEKNIIYEKEIPLNSDGSVFGQVDLPNDAKTGFYQLKIELKNANNVWTWDNVVNFQVEQFRKPDYFLKIDTQKDKIILKDKVAFRIRGEYFSSQPVSGQEVQYRILSNDYYSYEYQEDRVAGLSDDYRYGSWSYTEIEKSNATLNSRGEAEIVFDTNKITNKGKNQVLTIEAELDNKSGNPAFARKNILVLAGEYDFFRKDYQWVFKVNERINVPLVAISSSGEQIGNKNFQIHVRREEWIEVQKKDQKYSSWEKIDEKMGDFKIQSDLKGEFSASFLPLKKGYYYFSIEGLDTRGNLIAKEFGVWVNDANSFNYNSGWQNKISIEADKKNYRVGENAVLTVAFDEKDHDVFVSTEREFVHDYKIVSLNGDRADLNFKSDTSFQPNMFVSAASFSFDKFNSATAVLNFNTDDRNLKINLKTDKEKYGPGDTVKIDVETKDKNGNPKSASLAIWAVDKAIFELVDERPPSIFNAFWSEKNNNIRNRNSLENINISDQAGGKGGCFTGDTKILTANGDKEIQNFKKGDYVLTRENQNSEKLVQAKVLNVLKHEVSGVLIINKHLKTTPEHKFFINNKFEEAGKIKKGDYLLDSNNKKVLVTSIEWVLGKQIVYNLEVENQNTFFAEKIYVHNQKGGGARSIFKDTAYWNPSVETDENGKGQIVFKLPDNLTTWVISSVGSTVDTVVGETKNEIIVTKNVVVRPILPNVLRIGDTLKVGALINNFTNNDEDFKVDLKFNGGEIMGLKTQNVKIAKEKSAEVYFAIKPQIASDKTEISFKAESMTDKNKSDEVLSKIKTIEFGFIEKKAKSFIGQQKNVINLNPKADKNKLEAKLSLSSSIIGSLPESMEYLVQYPYGCVEQTTSRFVPALIAKANPEIFPEIAGKKDLDLIINKSIKRLVDQQGDDNGWAWWGKQKSDAFVSAYVIEFLIQAKIQGYEVDRNIFQKVQTFFESDSTNEEERIIKTYGLSLLGSLDKKTTITNFKFLSPDILSLAILVNLKNGVLDSKLNGVNELILLSNTSGDEIYWNTGSLTRFGSKDASTAMAVRALLASGADKTIIQKAVKFLSRNKKSAYWSNTFGTAQTIIAFTEYEKVNKELNPNYSYSIVLDGESIYDGKFTKSNERNEIKLPVDKIRNGGILEIKKQGNGETYSTLEISEFLNEKKSKSKTNGISIVREYIFPKDEYLPAIGDVVTVKLTLKGRGVGDYFGVVSDTLPSGMIPINESFNNQQFQETNRRFNENWFNLVEREYTENGVIMAINNVLPTEQIFTYQARVVSSGEFFVPPASAELMYSPEFNGMSKGDFIKIGDVPEIIPEKYFSKKLSELKHVIFGLLSVLIVIIAVKIFFSVKNKIIKREELTHDKD